MLGGQQQQHHGTAIGNGVLPDDSNESGAQEVPLAEEISTKKLVAIMGAIWIGVYFAALGMPLVMTGSRFAEETLTFTDYHRHHHRRHTDRANFIIL